MKKLFILLTSIFAVSMLAMAQLKLYVHQNDGSYTEFIAAAVDSITFSEQTDETNNDNGYQWVDMGLPSGTLWATCNLGATKPTEYGDYYAWGETETKESYSPYTYKWFEGTNSFEIIKYGVLSIPDESGFIQTLLELEDDAAYVKLGGNWRMPTIEEFEELLDSRYTNSCLINKNNVKGYLIVSKKNGNTIFLPAAGYKNDNDVRFLGEDFYYFTSSLTEEELADVKGIGEYNEGLTTFFFDRTIGSSIRPVLAKTLDYTVQFDANGAEGEMTDIDAKYAQTITLPVCTYTNGEEPFRCWNTMADGSGTSYKANQKLTITENLTLYAIWGSKYRYVDLGLPSGLLWATCNIGAEKPEEYGDYFAWGEVEPLDENYKWGSDYKYGDRCSRVSFELVDDAARYNWGESWRVPLPEEIEELIAECEWTWTVLNNVNGYEVKGPNGNTIFLPAAGGAYWSSQGIRTYSQGGMGYYRGNLKACQSFSIMFDDGGMSAFIEMDQDNGYSIRPVRTKTTETYTLAFDANGAEGKMDTLTLEYAEYKILPTTAFKRDGYRFVSWNTEADGTGVAYTKLSQITLTQDVTLYAQWKKITEDNDFEYVDLGLSVSWATCNLGADTPEEFGDFYAWGEVETKSVYDWASYKWCTGTQDYITKYCSSSASGDFDNKSVLEKEDDVASVNNGGNWRMPSKAEFEELIANCTITAIGNYAFKFTASNGNSIILPFGGFAKEDGTIKSKGVYGYYWTNELSDTQSNQAKDLVISNQEDFRQTKFYDGNRCCGLSIRPVLP